MKPDRLLDLFCELARIESPSRHEGAMAARCKRELEELGFAVRFDDSAQKTGSDVGNLIAELPGTAAGSIVLSAHMDTVVPCAGIEPVVGDDGVIRSAGDTILSADDKSGVAGIFEAVRSVLESGAPRPHITVLLSTCEELSLLGAGAFDVDVLPEGAPVYVFDADGAPGTIIAAAPSHHTLRATFTGKAAHAGVEPEAGVSAIQMAAAAIAAMPLGRIDECTTANMGLIEGGREVNIVADRCWLSGECRSYYADRALRLRDAITQACERAADEFGGQVDVQWRTDYEAVLYDENDPLVQGIARAARAAGLTPRIHHSGGGADANKYASRGARAITLGTGMTNFHTTDEHISVADLQGVALLVEALIAEAVAAAAE